ncbi:hypothetical protein [Chryseobacterium mulctrae]|uniref:hypothetical protein n=1 Tax=Chryseobacterium mulctrae TaxID=2576777 RepID=UPI00111633D7|nr:hypothetical protein [Chryseobacterium mulctrae]
MKTFQLAILLFILFSCKKENIYYYSDNKTIKDSTVIRFVDEELEKLKIDTKEKNLKIYTTLDSTSYKSNLDSIRNKIFDSSLNYNLKPEDKKVFDEWFREKIIIVDNSTRKVVNFYSSFKTKKYDRNDLSMGGLRKIIRIGSALYKNSNSEISENYLANYPSQVISGKDLEISQEEVQFLSNFNINNLNTKGYFYNYIPYLDAIKILQTYNGGLLKQPSVIEKVLINEKMVYLKKDNPRKIFDTKSLEKIRHLFSYQKKYSFGAFKNQLTNTQNLIFFGTNSDYYMIINDGKYTYFIYIFGTVITNLDKKEYKIILPQIFKRVEIKYYNAIRK